MSLWQIIRQGFKVSVKEERGLDEMDLLENLNLFCAVRLTGRNDGTKELRNTCLNVNKDVPDYRETQSETSGLLHSSDSEQTQHTHLMD